jgi:hypothetical protein
MIRDLEQDAEKFHQELYREYYLAEGGLKEHLAISPIYERYAHLFSEPLVRSVLTSIGDREDRYFAEWVTLEHLENLVKDLTERISNTVRQATVEWDGRQESYHNLRPLMANERDLSRRHRLDELERAVTASANPERTERLRLFHNGAAHLGFDSYVTMCDQLRGLDLAGLTGQMRTLLEQTRDVFFPLLEELLDKIGVAVQEAATCDILALFRGSEFDALFPQALMIPALSDTLAGMGIDLAHQENLEVDTESRPLKTSRAFCCPIRIPEEVKLVTKPTGGLEDYASLLHEAGHAEHFVHIDADLPISFKRFGDNSVTEGYAFLFQYLLLNRDWVRRKLHLREIGEYLRLAHFRKLWLLRRYASKLLYEQQLHTALEGAEHKYVSILGDALGVTVHPESYLADTDDAFYCAQYLRAWIFEVQLRRFLEEQFGTEWFTTRGAGKYLISLWRRGQERRVEELATDMGYDGLTAKYLVQELVEFQDQ